MKDLFPEFYEPDFNELWQKAIIVFDTNVLLDLYKYPKAALDDFFAQLELMRDRLWLPNQVGYEYHYRREELIARQHDAYEEIKKKLNEFKSKIVDFEKNYNLHPDEKLEGKELLRPIAEAIQKTIDSISAKNHKKPSDLVTSENDPIRERLSAIFANRIGKPFSYEKLEEIGLEGEKRTKNKIPPGFNDKGNGDLIIWLQIIDYVIEYKVSVIFVSNDGKDDWVVKGKPCVELRREMYQKASVDFWIYKAESFLKEAKNRGILTVQPETIETAEEIAEQTIQEEKYRIVLNPAIYPYISTAQETANLLANYGADVESFAAQMRGMTDPNLWGIGGVADLLATQNALLDNFAINVGAYFNPSLGIAQEAANLAAGYGTDMMNFATQMGSVINPNVWGAGGTADLLATQNVNLHNFAANMGETINPSLSAAQEMARLYTWYDTDIKNFAASMGTAFYPYMSTAQEIAGLMAKQNAAMQGLVASMRAAIYPYSLTSQADEHNSLLDFDETNNPLEE